LIYMLFFVQTSLFCQSTDSLISRIKANYKIIQSNLSNYKMTATDVFGESTEGGLAVAYYDKTNLKYIDVTYFGENGKERFQLYYDKELFFALNTRYDYNRPIHWDAATAKKNQDTVAFDPDKTRITESRFYFHDRKLIRLLEHDHSVDPKLAYFTNGQYYMLQRSDKLKEAVKQPANKK